MISQSIPDKQKEILRAALSLFVNYGFHGTPTSMIAKEAGVANGTLFHYYKTKDELIVALYISVKMRMTECVMMAGISDEPLREKCRKFYTSALNWGLDNSLEFRFLQQITSSPYLHMVPEEFHKQGLAWMEVIRKGINEGEIKDLAPDYINTIISSHLFGVNQYIVNAGIGGAARKKMIAESFDMVWKMISS